MTPILQLRCWLAVLRRQRELGDKTVDNLIAVLDGELSVHEKFLAEAIADGERKKHQAEPNLFQP